MADDELAKFHRATTEKEADASPVSGNRLQNSVFYVVVGLPLLLAAKALLEQLERSQCPIGSFLSGSLHADYEYFSVLVAIFGAIWLIRLWLTDHWAWLRRRLRPGIASKKTQPWAYGLAAACAIFGAALSAWVSLSQFCATPEGLVYRLELGAAERSYNWNRLAGIATSCSRGKYSWHTSYVVVMDDRARFDLMQSPQAFEHAYKDVIKALHNRYSTFDKSRVSARCDSQYLRLLVNEP